MVVFVDNGKNIEFETTLQISGSDQVHLLDIVVMGWIFFGLTGCRLGFPYLFKTLFMVETEGACIPNSFNS